MNKIAVVVQGLFEKSDSIGYDAVYQYRCLRDTKDDVFLDVRLFARTFDKTVHPDLDVGNYQEFISFCNTNAGDTIIIYHFCDGWPDLELFLTSWPGHAAVRWHNNTPPWFYAATNARATSRSITGFRRIIALAERPRTHIWVNSEFTRKQLNSLVGSPVSTQVVFPASRYLQKSTPSFETNQRVGSLHAQNTSIRILFVSRVVAHKGYLHLIEVARCVQNIASLPVILDIAGRWDTSAMAFNDGLTRAAEQSGVVVKFHGEVSESELLELYHSADVFLCLSEHEGFGMPVFEAMRCQVPVVAWACTSFAELLSGHPFAFRDFDVATFAAAVLKLVEPETLRRVLQVQEGILARYTPDIVRAQLIEAITQMQSSIRVPGDTTAILTGHDCAASPFEIGALTHKARAYLGSRYRPPVHDSTENLVSLRDLDVFESFLVNFKHVDGKRVGEDLECSVISIPASDFITRHSKPGKLGIILPGSIPENEGHVVFGPYITVAAGCYVITFKLFGLNGSDRRIVIETDVAGEKQGIIRSQKRSTPAGAEFQPVSIAFEIKDKYDVIEFRIRSGDFRGALIEFGGVDLTRFPTATGFGRIVGQVADRWRAALNAIRN
jgi:glycosyltransferase involved in cell wall biosynthesis